MKTESRELRVLNELASAVAGGPYEVEDVLERICTEVRRSFEFERALLVRLNPRSRTVHAVVQQNVDWPAGEWVALTEFPFLEQAMERRETVLVTDAGSPSSHAESIIDRFGVGSEVAVPLSVEDRTLGFLVLDRIDGHFKLAEEELQLLTALGCIAAVLIDKADQFAKLERALDELRGIGDAKTQFISIASHELRAPIAVVHGIASTLYLRGADLSDEQHVALRATLFEQTSRLAELVEQLLDLSQLEAGGMVLEAVPFHPRERIDELLPRIAPDRISDVDVQVDPALVILTDPQGFERVVSNLITNAFRHGTPPVAVRSEAQDAFRLVVEDSGSGVDPAFEHRLFDRFARGNETLQAGSGAGLGLSIARSFAVALGGDLSYERGAPTGARFTLELPPEVLVAA